MHHTKRMEEFSKAYVHAVASTAGFGFDVRQQDFDSIDAILSSGAEFSRRPSLGVQLKSTGQPIDNDDAIQFDLKKKNYDELRIEDLIMPRILVVVVLPQDCFEWIGHSEQEMALRRCGYWVSLRGEGDSPNTTKVRVNLPRKNRFTPEALTAIMHRVNGGGLP